MTTREKIKTIKLGVERRKLIGYFLDFADEERLLLQQVYFDIIHRHSGVALRIHNIKRMVRAVHNLIDEKRIK